MPYAADFFGHVQQHVSYRLFGMNNNRRRLADSIEIIIQSIGSYEGIDPVFPAESGNSRGGLSSQGRRQMQAKSDAVIR